MAPIRSDDWNVISGGRIWGGTEAGRPGRAAAGQAPMNEIIAMLPWMIGLIAAAAAAKVA